MVRLLIGVFIASLALFFFGFLYWGLNTLPYQSWSQPNDEPGAIEALRNHFPQRGTYFIPARDPDMKVTEEKLKQGPLAFVTVLSTSGRPMVDPVIMIQGYLLSLVVLFVIALQLRQVRASLASYSSRVVFTTVAGLTAVLMIDFGDAVWWELPWDWQLWKSAYHLAGWLIAGLILAKFIDDRFPAAEAK